MNQEILEKQRRLEELRQRVKKTSAGSFDEQNILKEIELLETEILVGSRELPNTNLVQNSSQFRKYNGVLSPSKYLFITGVAFMIGMGIIFLCQSDAIMSQGFNEYLRSLLLISLGLCAGIGVFGGLQFYAVQSGNIQGGILRFGIPIIVTVIVSGIGFYFVSYMAPFPLTVHVYGKEAQEDVILNNDGIVMLSVDDERLVKGIREDGIAYFPLIPAKFRQKPISVAVIANGVNIAETTKPYIIKNGELDVEVKPHQALSNVLKSDGTDVD